MRKVEYTEETSFGPITKEGHFHTWGMFILTVTNQVGQVIDMKTVTHAIIEKDDGTLTHVPLEAIKFLEPVEESWKS